MGRHSAEAAAELGLTPLVAWSGGWAFGETIPVIDPPCFTRIDLVREGWYWQVQVTLIP